MLAVGDIGGKGLLRLGRVAVLVAAVGITAGRCSSLQEIATLPSQIKSERALFRVLADEGSRQNAYRCPPLTVAASPVQRTVGEVAEALERVRVRNPGSPLTLMLLARADCLLGKGADAVVLYRQYALVHQRDQQVWWDAGQLAEKNDLWNEAVRTYRLAIAASPGTAEWRARLGNALYMSGAGYDSALREIDAAAALKPEGQFYAMGGQILMKERRYREAEKWFANAIRTDPKRPYWYLLRADSQWASGDRAGASELCTMLLKQFPDYPQGYFECAWGARLLERRELSVTLIERALALSRGREPWYWVRAGEIYEWSGAPRKALEAYRAALALDESIDMAIEGVKRLNGEK